MVPTCFSHFIFIKPKTIPVYSQESLTGLYWKTTACRCMVPFLCAKAKIKSHCNLRVLPAFVVGLWVSAGGIWEYVQLLSPPGLPNNVPVFDPVSQHLAFRRS